MNHLEYAQRLRQLKLYSVYGRLLIADIIKCWKVFHSEVDVVLCDLFVRAPNLGTWGHTYKLSRPRCKNDTKEIFFNFRIINIWNSHHSGIVDWFKKKLDAALRERLFNV